MVLCPDLTEVAKCGKIQMLRRKDISSKQKIVSVKEQFLEQNFKESTCNMSNHSVQYVLLWHDSDEARGCRGVKAQPGFPWSECQVEFGDKSLYVT